MKKPELPIRPCRKILVQCIWPNRLGTLQTTSSDSTFLSRSCVRPPFIGTFPLFPIARRVVDASKLARLEIVGIVLESHRFAMLVTRAGLNPRISANLKKKKINAIRALKKTICFGLTNIFCCSK